MTMKPSELLVHVLAEAERLGERLRIWDCKVIYDLCGEYEGRLTESAGSPQKVMYLACEMAHEALMIERDRAKTILRLVQDDGKDEYDDDFCRGWRAAADAARVELLDELPGPEWMRANDN